MSKSHDAETTSESFAASDDQVILHVASSHANLLGIVMNNHGVRKAINRALAAGVPWADILAIILPLIGSIFSGGAIDWQSIIAAILALITKQKAQPA
jgi:hypothetical protein